MHSASFGMADACIDPAQASWRRRVGCNCDRVPFIENLMSSALPILYLASMTVARTKPAPT
jgi:hypothetical protein